MTGDHDAAIASAPPQQPVPARSPTIDFFCGCSRATWRDLAHPASAPVEDRQPLLHIEHNADRRLGLSFTPC